MPNQDLRIKQTVTVEKEYKYNHDEIFMQPTATSTDPLAQSEKVLGEETNIDRFSVINKTNKGELEMAKKKVIDEEIEAPEDSEEEKKLKKEEEEKPDKEELEKESEDDKEELDKENEEEETAEDEDSEEDKKKKKKLKKEEGDGESPEDDTESATDANSTITPNLSVPSQGQDVFVPPSDVNVSREQETPMGKSVNPDLMKSPLFVSLSSQIDGIRDAVGKKVDALEKSVNDRLNNVLKDMAKIEKFYKQSFYKAIDENVAPESTINVPISKQIEEGKIRFRNK